MKFSKKEPVQVRMPLYMESLDGHPYQALVMGVVIPGDLKPQTIIDVISIFDGQKIELEELLARRSLMYPDESFKKLEEEIRLAMVDCGENDH